MKKIQNIVTGVVALFAFVVFAVVPIASAVETNSGGNGMRVSPVKTELTVDQGTSKTVSVSLQNVTKSDSDYRVLLNDFTASTDESGAPALFLNGEENDKHGLKKYMSAPETVTVKAGQQKTIPVTITLPKGLAGGGYYGAVRFIPAGNSQENNVALAGSVASLILVKVPGDVVEKLSLVSFDARQGGDQKILFTSGEGINAMVRFRNEGNVQEQPFGKVVLKKNGKVIGTYPVNSNEVPGPGNVLPDSIRRFEVELKDVGSFGKYTIEGNFGYGSDGQLLTASSTFYVVPLWMIIAIIVLVLALVAGFTYVSRKRRTPRHRAKN